MLRRGWALAGEASRSEVDWKQLWCRHMMSCACTWPRMHSRLWGFECACFQCSYFVFMRLTFETSSRAGRIFYFLPSVKCLVCNFRPPAPICCCLATRGAFYIALTVYILNNTLLAIGLLNPPWAICIEMHNAASISALIITLLTFSV